MKMILLILAAGVAFAQDSQLVWPKAPEFTMNSHAASGAIQAEGKYLVEYTKEEPCGMMDCGFTASNCVSWTTYPGQMSCPPATHPVKRYAEFPTIKEALAYINAKTGAFTRLLSFAEVPLDKDVSVTEEPRPPVRHEIVKYRYGSETGEPSIDGGSLAGPGSGTVTVLGDGTNLVWSGTTLVDSSTLLKFADSTNHTISIPSAESACASLAKNGEIKFVPCSNTTKKKKR